MDLDGQGVDVERDPVTPGTSVFGPQVAAGQLQGCLAQKLEVVGARQHRRTARQGWLRCQSTLREERHSGRGTDRQPHRRVVPECIGIVVVAPPLGCQQNHCSKKVRQVVDDIGQMAVVLHPFGHPRDDAGGVEHFPQQYSTRIAGQAFGRGLDRK